MKAICIDARMIRSSGIGTYLSNLLPFLKRAGYRVILLVHPEHLEEVRARYSLETISLPASIYSVAEQALLSIKIPRCDLFWSPHYNVPLLPIRAKKRMVTIHDVYHLAYYDTLTPLQKLYAKTVIQRSVKISDQIITDSEFSKNELIKYTCLDQTKLRVIPLGVNQNRFDLSEKCSKDLFLKTRSLPERFILFVSNLKPHKNIRGLIAAFAHLVDRGFSDLHLVIVGKKEGFETGEDTASLGVLYAELEKKIHFLGLVSDEELSMLYKTAHVFVHPSFYEGFGFPPLEAMSSGCPTIVSHCASLPEVCGDAALYFNPHLPNEMADLIERVLSDTNLRDEMKRKGRERSAEFSWEKCANDHLNAIDQVLSI